MIDYPALFPYDDYTDFQKRLANEHHIKELIQDFKKHNGDRSLLSSQHLEVVSQTSSMTSKSQARAHSRNNMTSNYQKCQDYKSALELCIYFPKKTKSKHMGWSEYAKSIIFAYLDGGGNIHDAEEYFFNTCFDSIYYTVPEFKIEQIGKAYLSGGGGSLESAKEYIYRHHYDTLFECDPDKII